MTWSELEIGSENKGEAVGIFVSKASRIVSVVLPDHAEIDFESEFIVFKRQLLADDILLPEKVPVVKAEIPPEVKTAVLEP